MLIYQTDHSPFVARLRMAVHAKGIEVEWADPPDGPGSAAFAKISPLARVPVMVDRGLTLPESEVILDYIEDRHPEPPLTPADPADAARSRLLARLADTYLAEPLREHFEAIKAETKPPNAVYEQVDRALGWIDHYLGDGGYAVGNRLTRADCALVPLLFFVNRCRPLQPHDRLAAYWRRIVQDPVARRVVDEMTQAQARRAEERARTGANRIR
ncbi:MAG: glutathione S-transferase family protein [Lautropia sp.]